MLQMFDSKKWVFFFFALKFTATVKNWSSYILNEIIQQLSLYISPAFMFKVQ